MAWHPLAEGGMFRDSSGARLAPAALAILAAAPDAMMLVDQRGIIVESNVLADRLFGYEPGTLRGRRLDVLIPAPVRERHAAHCRDFHLLAARRLMLDVYGVRADGTELPLDISLSPLTETGELTIAAIRDTSEQRRAQTRFHALLEAAPDAMAIVDANGRIQLVNSLAERLFGYTRAELIGVEVEALIPLRSRAAHQEHRRRYFEAPYTRPMGTAGVEQFGRRKDGTEFPAEISLSPLESADRGRVVIAAIRDLSACKEAERERFRLAQAQEAVRMRDEFLSIAAHELRTPLTGLTLRLQSLMSTVAERGDDAVHLRRQVGRAMRQTRRLAALVESLLDLSQILAGQIALQQEPTDLAKLTVDLVDAHAEQAHAAGSNITSRVPEHLPCELDRSRVEQVLGNLLSNAIKYGRGRPIEVGLVQRGTSAELSVRDHGIGIAPADIARIFGKFERAVSHRNYGGFGLGLFISRHLVEAHGGTIRVESKSGEGSSFIVSLPLAPPPGGSPAVAG